MQILFTTQDGIQGGVETKTRAEWLSQGNAAFAEYEATGFGGDLFTWREKRPDLAFKLIQALDALGQPIDDETRNWAMEYGRKH